MIWFWILLISLMLLSTWIIAKEANRELDAFIRNWHNDSGEEE